MGKENLQESIKNFRTKLRSAGERSREKDRSFDRPVGRLSTFLWPFREEWLLAIVGSLFAFDYVSTYFAMQNANVVEDGPLAAWALRTGGFTFPFAIDILAAAVFSLLAFAARCVYRRSGLNGYGRAAIVILLLPYVVRTAVAVVGNILLALK